MLCNYRSHYLNGRIKGTTLSLLDESYWITVPWIPGCKQDGECFVGFVYCQHGFISAPS